MFIVASYQGLTDGRYSGPTLLLLLPVGGFKNARQAWFEPCSFWFMVGALICKFMIRFLSFFYTQNNL